MHIIPFHHPETGTLTYVVHDTQTCIIIDPCLDFNLHTGALKHQTINHILNFIKQQKLSVAWVLETHIHADHLTAADYCRQQTQCRIGISAQIPQVHQTWAKKLSLEPYNTNRPPFDKLLTEKTQITVNQLNVKIIETPGHTPACLSFLINDQALFVGDALFMPEHGCGRCDFPEGSAQTLYQSIQKLYQLNDDVTVYTGHNYPQPNEPFQASASLKEHKKNNIMITNACTKKEFCHKRQTKDAKLNPPKLLLAALQVNLNAGQVPNMINIPIIMAD
jgi:glyoxylase-like metal-dependent hydrolase (beta-lactamase superfamily II)